MDNGHLVAWGQLWVTLVGVGVTILIPAAGGLIALWSRLARIEAKLDAIADRLDQHVQDDQHKFDRLDSAIDRHAMQAERLTRLEVQQQGGQRR